MKSIRRKITLSYFAIAAGTLIITGALLLVTTRIVARQVQTESLRRTAGDLLPEMQDLLAGENNPAQIDRFIRVVESVGGVEIRFFGPDGEVDPALLLRNRTQSRFAPGPRPGTGHMMQPHTELNMMLDRFMDSDAREFIEERTRPGPNGVLRVDAGDEATYFELADRTGLSQRITRLAGIGFLVAAIITLGAAGLTGVLVGSGISQPIVRLTRTVTTMRSGNLDARAEATSPDEIGTLATQFNDMADDLRETILALRAERDSLREFLADASHELRTPLAAMKTFVELLQDEAPERLELLGDLEQQVQRMGNTVANLLTLSRLDGGVAALDISAVPISDMLHEAWDSVGATTAAESARFEIVAEPDAPDHLYGDRHRLITVFENLFQNSINASGGQADIVCHIARSGRFVRVSVIDTGAGIPTAELERVFDRFHRSADNPAEGSGLGLSIAKAIVTLHGGEIRASSPPPGRSAGTQIAVSLPPDTPA